MKRKYLKVALPAELYAALSRAADEQGLTLASLVRTNLERRGAPIEVDRLEGRLASIEAQLTSRVQHEVSHGQEQLLTEILLLVRELACERNAQVIARVRQQVAVRFGGKVES
jgi:hypothetical protein